jgi:hypothetical protein
MAESNQYVYHYTDKEGIKGILESGKIRPSVDTQRDAMMGKGVYLTSKDPSTSTKDLLDNNYDSAAKNPEKVDHYIKFNERDVGKVQKYDGERDVVLKPGRGLDLKKAEAIGERQTDGSYVERNLKDGSTRSSK